jgi:signal peptidase II
MARLGAELAVFGSLVFLVGCDHATKGLATAELDSGNVLSLIRGVMDLHYVENTDIAFNLLSWVPETIRGPGLLVVGAISVLALGFVLLRARSQPPMRRFAFVLLTAGAIGNTLDRVVRGYVVDFVHFHHWPVFNVADAYVTIGFILLGVEGFGLRKRRPPQQASG